LSVVSFQELCQLSLTWRGANSSVLCS
jgi:hypothetical protein